MYIIMTHHCPPLLNEHVLDNMDPVQISLVVNLMVEQPHSTVHHHRACLSQRRVWTV